MVFYKIQYEHGVKKDLKKLSKPVIKRLVAAVDQLASEPCPPASKQLANSDLRSLRVGDYRIIYVVEKKLISVIVIRIRHRKDVYKLLV